MMHHFLRQRRSPPLVVGILIGLSLALLLGGMYLLIG